MRLKRIEPLSLGKLFGILYALMALIIGAFITVFSLVGIAVNSQAGLFGLIFGIGAIILLPIFYGIAGFLIGLIGALLYNLVAKWTGGIELEFEK